jgi:hypothetical protein
MKSSSISLRSILTVLLAAVLAVVSSSATGSRTAHAAAVPAAQAYVGVTPARLLDTRPGGSTIDGVSAGAGKAAAASTTVVKVAGRGGIPTAGVAAVVLNVTALDASDETFLTVYPAGTSRPNTSSLNPRPGRVAPVVTTALGTSGEIAVYNAVGSVEVLVDVAGWFPIGGSYVPIVPSRTSRYPPGFGHC